MELEAVLAARSNWCGFEGSGVGPGLRDEFGKRLKVCVWVSARACLRREAVCVGEECVCVCRR